MRAPVTAISRITHRLSGDASALRAVPEETPVALSYGGTTHAVMMATPADLEDFAYGFTLTEGIITAPEEIEAIEIEQAGTGIDIQIRLKDRANTRFEARRRRLAGPVGCGLCGIESIDEAMRSVPEVGPGDFTLSPQDIALAVRLLAEQQPFHAETGAVHAAGFYVPYSGQVETEGLTRGNTPTPYPSPQGGGELEPAAPTLLTPGAVHAAGFYLRQVTLPPPLTPPLKGEGDGGLSPLRSGHKVSESPSPLRGGVRGGGLDVRNSGRPLITGQLIAAREDVGRHNALDKLAGALARSGVDGATGAVVVTSRVSVEMIQKTAAIGAPFILAVSAPTALAVRTAEAAGITLVALVRGDEYDVFAHPERIKHGGTSDGA